MLNDCLFCAILAGEIPSTKVYEDEYVFAFRDINPQAPVHILVVPKKHIACALEIDEDNSLYVAKCFEAIAKIARAEGLEDGFRVQDPLAELDDPVHLPDADAFILAVLTGDAVAELSMYPLLRVINGQHVIDHQLLPGQHLCARFLV